MRHLRLPGPPRRPDRTARPPSANGATSARARLGATLVEVVAVIAVLAVAASVAVPRAARALDSIAVHSAIDAVASACALARSAAVMRGMLAYVTIDSAARRVRVTVGTDTLLDHTLRGESGGGTLSIRSNRPKIAYAPTGLGFGAANMTVIARQGAAADTLVTSRLGRVRK